MRKYESIFKKKKLKENYKDDISITIDELIKLSVLAKEVERADYEELLDEAAKEEAGETETLDFEDPQIFIFRDRIVLAFSRVTFNTKGFGKEDLEDVRIIKSVKDKKWAYVG